MGFFIFIAVGAVLTLLAFTISSIIYSKILRACRVEPGTEGAFQYRHGRWYDREKYVKMRADYLHTTTELNLKSAASNRRRQVERSKYPEYVRAELDAYALALKNREKGE